MDDHMLDRVLDYGSYGLVPRFQEEYKKFGSMQKCPSYEEVRDYCKVLTLISKWSSRNGEGYHYKPSDLLSWE